MSQTTFVTKSLASNGGATGILTVDTNALFVPNCIVYLASTTQPTKTLRVRALIGGTEFSVYDPSGSSFFTNFNCSAYLTADSATVTQPPQPNSAAEDDGIESPLTTKGDLYGFSTAPDRFPVGTDGQVLSADSTNAFGISWAAGGGSGITTFGAVGSSPSANGATVSGTTATLQPADATHPGVIAGSGAQTLGATLTLSNLLTMSSGFSASANSLLGVDASSNTTLATSVSLRGPSLVAGGTADQAGGNLTLATGSGKGAGTAPAVIIKAPPLGSTGTTLTTPVAVGTFAYRDNATGNKPTLAMGDGGCLYMGGGGAAPAIDFSGAISVGYILLNDNNNNAIRFYDAGAGYEAIGIDTSIGAQKLRVGGALITSNTTGIVAHSGGGQGSATALTADFNRVDTIGLSLDSVLLPAGTVNRRVLVLNNGDNAAVALNIFPQSGAAIDALGANTAYTLAGASGIPTMREFICYDGTNWISR